MHKSLQADLRYCALSYTWGDPVFSQQVILNGQQFKITQNLYNALRRLTNRHEWKPRLVAKGDLLWIDAICIDQNNKAERAQQVRLMTKLYERAEKIYVWLGEPENRLYTELATQKMKEFLDMQRRTQMKNHSYRPWWMPKEAPRWQSDLYREALEIPVGSKHICDVEGSATYNAWLGIIALWRKPWWTRTWVFQEATIPEKITSFYVSGVGMIPRESKVVFLCGWSYIPWDYLFSAMTVARQLQWNPRPDTTFILKSGLACGRLVKLRSQRFQGLQTSFLDLLQIFRVTDCRDPRDKVYAAIGLSPADVKEKIVVDYERTVADVYLDVVYYTFAQARRELDFLGYTILSEVQSFQLPSWVPNWNNSAAISSLPKHLYITNPSHGLAIKPFDRRNLPTHDLKATKLRAYNASGDSKLRASINKAHLCIDGIYCDTIIDINKNNSHTKAQEWGSRSGGRYFNNEPFDAALRRAWSADIQYDSLGRACARNGSIDFELLRKPNAELTLEQFERQDRMETAYAAATRMRRLCLTQKGFLGLAPKSAVIGDEIYAFLGAQVLYTSRRNRSGTSQFTYVGECYLHGLMDGEVMAWVGRGAAKIGTLTLV